MENKKRVLPTLTFLYGMSAMESQLRPYMPTPEISVDPVYRDGGFRQRIATTLSKKQQKARNKNKSAKKSRKRNR